MLIKSTLLAVALMFGTSSFAAEPSKPAPKQEAKKKSCDALKDKNCKKQAPSANKPVPKKKVDKAK